MSTTTMTSTMTLTCASYDNGQMDMTSSTTNKSVSYVEDKEEFAETTTTTTCDGSFVIVDAATGEVKVGPSESPIAITVTVASEADTKDDTNPEAETETEAAAEPDSDRISTEQPDVVHNNTPVKPDVVHSEGESDMMESTILAPEATSESIIPAPEATNNMVESTIPAPEATSESTIPAPDATSECCAQQLCSPATEEVDQTASSPVEDQVTTSAVEEKSADQQEGGADGAGVSPSKTGVVGDEIVVTTAADNN